MFFRKRAELWDEYDHLYNTLFSNSVNCTKVIEVLSEKGKVTQEAILQLKLVKDNYGTKVISICEMKFADIEYQITKDYDEKIKNKMSVFRTVTKTKKALQLVMITTYGLTRGMYSNRVQQQVLLDDLFEDIKF